MRTFDAAISIFGVIYAAPQRASRELLRVVRPQGRIVLTTWLPDGPAQGVANVVAQALGALGGPPAWVPRHEPTATLRRLSRTRHTSLGGRRHRRGPHRRLSRRRESYVAALGERNDPQSTALRENLTTGARDLFVEVGAAAIAKAKQSGLG